MLAMMVLEESGPNRELAWLLYVFLAFFFLMVIVGWLTSRRKTEEPEVWHEAHDHPAAETPVEETVVQAAASPIETAPEVPDDLVRLEGIGPRVAKILNDAGITTFAALAAANPVEIQKTLSAAGLQMMNPEGWIEQAALAAQGDWATLEKLQGDLKGGRRK